MGFTVASIRHRFPVRGGGAEGRIASEGGGIGTGGAAAMLPFSEMNALMGFPAVHAFEGATARRGQR